MFLSVCSSCSLTVWSPQCVVSAEDQAKNRQVDKMCYKTNVILPYFSPLYNKMTWFGLLTALIQHSLMIIACEKHLLSSSNVCCSTEVHCITISTGMEQQIPLNSDGYIPHTGQDNAPHPGQHTVYETVSILCVRTTCDPIISISV